MDARSASVLVAEDREGSRLLIKRLLEQEGFNVTTAEDGLEALEQLQRGQFNLLITDEHMPNLSGMDLCQRLRANERFVALPIIMVTLKAYELAPIHLQKSFGIVGVLRKPFSPTHLLKLVRTALAVNEVARGC